MKKALAVGLILIMALTFSTAALASETVSVPLGGFTWVNNDNQKGWRTNGMDDVATNLPWEVFSAAQGLTFTVNKMPEGDNIALVFQGDGTPGWPWAQMEVLISTVFTENEAGDGGRFTFNFSNHPDWNAIKGGSIGKFLIGYWGDGSGNIDTLGIVSASLFGVPASVAEDAGVATGAVTFVALAAAVLAISGGGAVIVSRKLKK